MTLVQPSACLATALATILSTTWHNRLGHPEAQSISFLRHNKFITCNKEHDSTLYHSSQIGKHVT